MTIRYFLKIFFYVVIVVDATLAWSAPLNIWQKEALRISNPPLIERGEPFDRIYPLAALVRSLSLTGSVALSPDGNILAAGTPLGEIVFWNLQTGRERGRLVAHSGRITAIAFNATGKTFASAGADKTLRVWNVESWVEIYRLAELSSPVRSISFSGDGLRILSTDESDVLKVWSGENGKLIRNLRGHKGSVLDGRFSFDGALIASSGSDATVRLWDLALGRERSTLIGHEGPVRSIAIDGSGKFIASAGSDRTVRIWDSESGNELTVLSGFENEIRRVTYGMDSRLLAVGTTAGVIHIWNPLEKRELARLSAHRGAIENLVFDASRYSLLSSGTDGSVRIWDIGTGKEKFAVSERDGTAVSMAMSMNGRVLGVNSKDGVLRVWDLQKGSERFRWPDASSLNSNIDIGYEDKRIAAVGNDADVHVFDISSGLEVFRVNRKRSLTTAVALSPTDNIIAVSGDGSGLRLWDMTTGRELVADNPLATEFQQLKFSPDGKKIAASTSNGIVKVFTVESGVEVAAHRGHSGGIRSLTFSNNGRLIAGGLSDGSIKIWDLLAGKEVVTLPGRKSAVNSLVFDRNNELLVADDLKSTVMWDMRTFRERSRTPSRRQDDVMSLISPDLRFTATAGPRSGGSIRLIDLENGEESALLLGNKNGSWLFCRQKVSVCARADSGDLLYKEDIWPNEFAPVPPQGQPQTLSVQSNSFPKAEVQIPANALSEFALKVTNNGGAPAFWVSLEFEGLDRSVANRWNFVSSRVPRVDPGETVTVKVDMRYISEMTDPKSASLVVKPRLVQSHGYSIDLEHITIKAVPPLLSYEAQIRTTEGAKESDLILDVVNTGAVARSIEITARLRQGNVYTKQVDNLVSGAAGRITWLLKPTPDASQILQVEARTMPGFPMLSWKQRDVDIKRASGYPDSRQILPQDNSGGFWRDSLIRIAGVGFSLAAAVLVLVLLSLLYFEKFYRNPTVLKLAADPRRILSMDPSEFSRIHMLLFFTGRWKEFLRSAEIDPSRFSAVEKWDARAADGSNLLALGARLGCRVARVDSDSWRFTPSDSFPIRLNNLFVEQPAIDVDLSVLVEKIVERDECTIIIGTSFEQRAKLLHSFKRIAKNFPPIFIVPSGRELINILLSAEPEIELSLLICKYLPLEEISPYRPNSGLPNSSVFFGRDHLLAEIERNSNSNYILIGGRQLGKTSILKELVRRCEASGSAKAVFIHVDKDRLVSQVAEAMSLPFDSSLDQVIDAIRRWRGQRLIFALDEVDRFILTDAENKFDVLWRLRGLSANKKIQFVLAGFWRLHQHASATYISALKNFGEIIRVGALERSACIQLAVRPMARMGIRWENQVLVESLVESAGQRANIINKVCQVLVNNLGPTDRLISAERVREAINTRTVRDELDLGSESIDGTPIELLLDRIIVFATLGVGEFSLTSLLAILESLKLSVDIDMLKQSVDRLEYAFVLGFDGEKYRFQVPMQRAYFKSQAPDITLAAHIRRWKNKGG